MDTLRANLVFNFIPPLALVLRLAFSYLKKLYPPLWIIGE